MIIDLNSNPYGSYRVKHAAHLSAFRGNATRTGARDAPFLDYILSKERKR